MGKAPRFQQDLGDVMPCEEIIRTLYNLASDADEQVRYLESLHLPNYVKLDGPDLRNVDELALEFDHAILVRKTLRRRGELSGEQLKYLLRLASSLSSMSGPENYELWTIDALYNRAEWGVIRAKALECLKLLNKVQ